ncbi:hypothetical protein [Streptomyces sp. NBC_00457]|uniref:hypothetical protein n=1 Tax=Streptomyces sp. NBC_00457 TaxID=2975748 RepID=UPI003FCCF14E
MAAPIDHPETTQGDRAERPGGAHALDRHSGVFRAPRQGGDRLLAWDESEGVRLRGTGTLGNRLGRGAVVAVERELDDHSARMVLSRLSCLLIRRVPPCRRVPVSST